MTSTTLNETTTVDIGQWLTRGWDLVASEFGNFILLTAIYLGLLLAASATGIGVLIIFGATTVGYFYVILQKARGKSVNVGEIAKGFQPFVPAFLAGLLIPLLVTLGLAFLIIPGIIVMASYMFAFPLIIEQKLGFWDAMETSRRKVWDRLFEFSVFALVLGLIGLIGFLLFGLGLLIALPLIFGAITVAYIDVFGIHSI